MGEGDSGGAPAYVWVIVILACVLVALCCCLVINVWARSQGEAEAQYEAAKAAEAKAKHEAKLEAEATRRGLLSSSANERGGREGIGGRGGGGGGGGAGDLSPGRYDPRRATCVPVPRRTMVAPPPPPGWLGPGDGGGGVSPGRFDPRRATCVPVPRLSSGAPPPPPTWGSGLGARSTRAEWSAEDIVQRATELMTQSQQGVSSRGASSRGDMSPSAHTSAPRLMDAERMVAQYTQAAYEKAQQAGSLRPGGPSSPAKRDSTLAIRTLMAEKGVPLVPLVATPLVTTPRRPSEVYAAQYKDLERLASTSLRSRDGKASGGGTLGGGDSEDDEDNLFEKLSDKSEGHGEGAGHEEAAAAWARVGEMTQAKDAPPSSSSSHDMHSRSSGGSTSRRSSSLGAVVSNLLDRVITKPPTVSTGAAQAAEAKTSKAAEAAGGAEGADSGETVADLALPKRGHPSRMTRARKANAVKGRTAFKCPVNVTAVLQSVPSIRRLSSLGNKAASGGAAAGLTSTNEDDAGEMDDAEEEGLGT